MLIKSYDLVICDEFCSLLSHFDFDRMEEPESIYNIFECIIKTSTQTYFLDGDILLSPLTKRVLTKLNLQKDTIYGIDRVNCYGFERFIEFKKSSGESARILSPLIASNFFISKRAGDE